MNPDVDAYLISGCGRCDLFDTPDCKVHSWTEELKLLRRIVLECGLTEEYKWSQPCYTFDGKNVLLITALKAFSCIGFLKGSLLSDPHGILEKAGKNSHVGRRISFTSVQAIADLEPVLKAYIYEAMEIEKAGLKVPTQKNPEPIPEELQAKFEEFPALQSAFEALTPGRQRGYIIYFTGAKQSKTRQSRIEKYIPKIMAGKGFHDR